MDSACSILFNIRGDNVISPIGSGDLARCKLVTASFRRCETSSPPTVDLNGDGVRPFMELCLKANQMMALREFLEGFYSQLRSSFETQALDLAVDLWQLFHSSVGFNRDTTVLHTWFPLLTRNIGKPELWRLLFQVSSEAFDLPGRRDCLLWKCMELWTDSHMEKCQEWILFQASSDKSGSLYDFGKFALFLTASSGQSSVVELITATQENRQSSWARTNEFVVAATSIALQSLLGEPPTESLLALVRRPHVRPPGLSLLILLSKVGKKQFRSVCGIMLSELSDPVKKEGHATIEVILLRLYLLFPHWMDLGAAVARQALVYAAQNNLDVWSHWTCYWDDRFDGWLEALAQQGEFGCSKALIELSRKQPLLILRKLPKISTLLSADASPGVGPVRNAVLPPHKILFASTRKNRSVKVSLRLWGDSFGERLWLLFLDVVQAMPPEVLYMIVPPWETFLMVYLELLSSTGSLTGRLKSRIGDVCGAYRQHNLKQWQKFSMRWDEWDDIRSIIESFEE
jgi:hypothetical protein